MISKRMSFISYAIGNYDTDTLADSEYRCNDNNKMS